MTGATDIQLDDAFLVVPDPQAPDYSRTIELLNELYIAESRSFFRYLETWEPYTDAKTIRLRTLCRRMMKTSFEHSDRLAHLIESLGGATITGAYSKDASHSNFTSWANLVPRLIESKRDMIARAEIVLHAVAALPGADKVAPTLREIITEDRTDLAALEEWTRRLSHG